MTIVAMFVGPSKLYHWGKVISINTTVARGLTFSTNGQLVIVHLDASIVLIMRTSDGGLVNSRVIPSSISNYDGLTRRMYISSEDQIPQVYLSNSICPISGTCYGYHIMKFPYHPFVA